MKELLAASLNALEMLLSPPLKLLAATAKLVNAILCTVRGNIRGQGGHRPHGLPVVGSTFMRAEAEVPSEADRSRYSMESARIIWDSSSIGDDDDDVAEVLCCCCCFEEEGGRSMAKRSAER